jgi:predicted nucleotidyltransferase
MVVSTETVDETIDLFLNRLNKIIKINKAIVFGSYAKGTYDGASDIDVAIFSESFNGKKSIEINTFLFSLAGEFKEICIEPIGFDVKDLFTDNPFVKEIIRTGREIHLQ